MDNLITANSAVLESVGSQTRPGQSHEVEAAEILLQLHRNDHELAGEGRRKVEDKELTSTAQPHRNKRYDSAAQRHSRSDMLRLPYGHPSVQALSTLADAASVHGVGIGQEYSSSRTISPNSDTNIAANQDTLISVERQHSAPDATSPSTRLRLLNTRRQGRAINTATNNNRFATNQSQSRRPVANISTYNNGAVTNHPQTNGATTFSYEYNQSAVIPSERPLSPKSVAPQPPSSQESDRPLNRRNQELYASLGDSDEDSEEAEDDEVVPKSR